MRMMTTLQNVVIRILALASVPRKALARGAADARARTGHEDDAWVRGRALLVAHLYRL